MKLNQVGSHALSTTSTTILTIVPVLLHWTLLFIFSSNVPWIDDFFWYFDFLKQADACGNIPDLIRTILTPYNNHWHVLQRCSILGIVWLGIPLNMVWLSVVGNVLFLTLFVLLFSLDNTGKREVSLATASAAWIFFQPVAHYNFFECAFFNLPVLLFAFLAIRAFSGQSNTAFAWAFLATISNGNGMLVWPVFVLIAFSHRNWKKALLVCAIFVATVLLYLLLSNGGKGPGKFNPKPLSELVLYFVQLCGSVLTDSTVVGPWLPTTLGILLLAIIILIAPSATRTHGPLYFFMVFLLMTMGVITLTRKEINGFTAVITNHYLLFPQLFFGCLIYYLSITYTATMERRVMLFAIAVLISCSSYLLKVPDLNGHNAAKTANVLNYELNRKWILYPPVQGTAEYQFANRATDYVISRGYYQSSFPKKSFLSEPCTCTVATAESIHISAGLNRRVLNRVLFVELSDKSGGKAFFPVDPYSGSLADWFLRKKNRRADAFFDLDVTHGSPDARSIVGCRLFTIN